MNTEIEIRPITFELIKPIWNNHLWPNRISPIEPTSALNFDLTIDMKIMDNPPFFWGAFLNQQIIGVISGHSTKTNIEFRSRGLWVSPQYRKKNVGTKLMAMLCDFALEKEHRLVWTLPRQESFLFYESQGFKKIKSTNQFEFGPHYLAIKSLIPD